MELDDLKTTWDALDRKLDHNIRLSTELLKAPVLRKARNASTRLLVAWQIELALAVLATALLAGFCAMNVVHPRFVFPGLALLVMAVALVSTYARRITAMRAVDFGGPVVTIQKQLEAIRIAEIRTTKWTLLLAPLAWTPFLIVVFRGLFHVDVFAVFPTAWLVGNVLFGVLVIAGERWVSYRYAERMQRSPRLQRWMRDLNGYNLKSAMAFIRTAGELESD